MIEEDYVSFETAKLLKEKGFDEITFTWYTGKGKFCVGKNNFDDYHMNHFSSFAITEKDKNKCSAPTLQQARKWIKENYKRHIEVRITNHSISDMVNVIRYYWIIFDVETARWMDESTIYKTDGFDTEEQAYENALRHILENIENYDENNERKKWD